MNPLATQLNEQIQSACPTMFSLLSERGRALYFPKGILSQSAEAREKAHRFNATIGEATEDHGPMALAAVLEHYSGISPAEAVRYAPAAGKPELRKAWREKLLRENPSLSGVTFGTPVVTHAITHGLSLVGDLFVDPGDRIVLPDKLWGNYRLTYEVRLGAKVETFPTYDGSGFNVAGLRETLLAGSGKSIVLLNFPNNPTGYMPTRAEVEGIRDAVIEAATAGQKLLVVCDDAYFGLVFDDAAIQESPFGLLSNIHENVLTVKLDGATKELFVWGLRCGFITFAPPVTGDPEAALAALEKKVMGAIRGGISNCTHSSQSVVLAALRSPTIDAERREKFEILKARALEVREVSLREAYRDSWDIYPFNAGYFMCVDVKGVDAEKLRLHLLEKYGVGLIAIGASDIRVAFSCLEKSEIEPLFDLLHQGIQELQ
ncbi:MAG: aminotransferase class I/II-fold pyridoxal phosphate-dependent enzyme [bacterium]|nr:aminotransferase class I/II-fold pyridoxal phosphate-dependent enzyme [bacterium]